MAEIHLRSMEALQNKSDITIQFLVGDLVIHFAGIFHLAGSVHKLFKNIVLVQCLKLFQFLGANTTSKNYFCKCRHRQKTLFTDNALALALL
jgi:hypothetical protein